MRSGVYKITNSVNSKFYIGSSVDIDYRWESEHRYNLRKGIHDNPKLQHAWDFYGEENFLMEMVEETEPTDSILLEKEQHYLDLFRPYERTIGYNICPTAKGGDNLKYHPRGKEIIQKWKDKYSKLYAGEGNPMFGKKHKKSSIKLQKEKAKGRYTLEWFVERYGEKRGEKKFQERRMMLSNRAPIINKATKLFNFKGKTHKKDLGDKQRKTREYFKNNWDEFSKLVKSGQYSQRQLSEMLGISRPILKNRIKQVK